MSPSTKKQFNTAVGGLFIALGLVAWGVAAVFALKPSDQRRLPPVVLAPSVDVGSCRQLLNSLYGFTTRVQGAEGDLVVTTQDITNPQKVLNDATSAMALCKRELVEFCMGTGCQEPGLTMTLAAPENQRKVAGASVATGAATTAAGPPPKTARK